jgi:hypothetical protein
MPVKPEQKPWKIAGYVLAWTLSILFWIGLILAFGGS